MLAGAGMPGLDAEAGRDSNLRAPGSEVVPPKRSANVVYCQVPPLTFASSAHRTGPLPALP